MKSSSPILSVVFPNLNGDKQELKTLLSSIRISNFPKDKLEIIMVDNGSTNESCAYVAKNFKEVQIVKLDKNYGFSKAVNLCTKGAKGKYIFVTNDDVKVEKNCLKNLVETMGNDPKIGIIGCKAFDFKKPKVVVSNALKYNFYTGSFKMTKDNGKLQIADWVAGFAIAFPKTVWQTLGGFDEGFFFSSEELDLCLRAKKAGFKIIYNPNAIVWHGGSTTIRRPEYLDFFIKIRYQGKIRLILKHCNPLQILTSLTCQYLFAIYKSQVLKEKSIRPILEATIWNLKNLPLKNG